MKSTHFLTLVLLIAGHAAFSQNVGIGTSTPAHRLHVVDSANDVRVMVESPAAGSEVFIRLLAGSNPFSFLNLTKYAPGALGTFAGFPKDNLSLLSTGGNAGPLMLATGDGVSPLLFAAGTGERMRLTAEGRLGIGTSTPAHRLHVVDSTNDVRVMVESPAAGSEVFIRLLAGSNPFSFLNLTKYAPGALGTYGGVPKDNLSLLSTGGNAGALMLATGDGVSPLLFAAGTGERMRLTAEGRLGIGTANPATANNLHIHSNDPATGTDVSIGITNSITGDAPLKGARLRMLNDNLTLTNYQTGGYIRFVTEGADAKMTILANGNVGIGEINPVHKLHIVTASSTNGILVVHSANGQVGIRSAMPGSNTVALSGSNSLNTVSGEYAVSVFGQSGTGGVMVTPVTNYGVIGESLNTSRGIGVFGGSNSPSPTLTEAAVIGLNWSTANDSYGIIGKSAGNTGAGVVGVSAKPGTFGVWGYAEGTNAIGMKAEVKNGFSGTALEVSNGPIKVTGANRTAFQHTAVAGNIIANETIIPNTTLANNSSDLLFVTPVWEGVYVNAPIGVYFSGGAWRIFRQDLGAMPLNAKFNVLVIKQ